MRSTRLHGPRDLRMHDEPVPQPCAGEVQIQIKSVGICASDLHYYRDGRIGSTLLTQPTVIGHEASGVITALGDGVDSLQVGDRVAIEPAKPCMECEYCKQGFYNVCPGIPFFGTPPTDGCLRDYITWPASLAVKVPNALNFDEAAMIEPLAVGVYAVELGHLQPDETVVIIGAGAIGLSVLQAAVAAGVLRVFVVEPIAARREAALKLGAVEVIDPGACELEEEVRRLTDGRGADVVFECAGEEETVRDACRVARVMGRLVIVGIPDGDDYPFEASCARRKQLSAVFVRRSNLTTKKSIELVEQGNVDAACYATHHFPLEEVADAMELGISRNDGVIRTIVAVSD